MATNNYKGLTIYEPATAEGGQILNANFKELVNRSGTICSDSGNPTITSSQPNFTVWSKWNNYTTNQMFFCIKDTAGAAEWVAINKFINDPSPMLSGNLIGNNYGLKYCSSLTSSSSFEIRSSDTTYVNTSNINFSGNDVTGILNISFGTGQKSITADSLSFIGTTTFGPIKFPNLDGISGQNLITDGAGNLSWKERSVTGAIIMWPANTIPIGWLRCDGGSYLVSSYTALFNILGYRYGGAGLYFAVPNFKGRTPFGLDASDVNFDNLTSNPTNYVGQNVVTLITSDLPPHTHTVPLGAGGSNSGAWADQGASASAFRTSMRGNDQAHNNLSPYMVFNYIIKT